MSSSSMGDQPHGLHPVGAAAPQGAAAAASSATPASLAAAAASLEAAGEAGLAAAAARAEALRGRAEALRERGALPGCRALPTALTRLPADASRAVLLLLPLEQRAAAAAVSLAWRDVAYAPELWERLAFDADKTSRKVFLGAVSRAGVRLVALSVERPLYSEEKYSSEISDRITLEDVVCACCGSLAELRITGWTPWHQFDTGGATVDLNSLTNILAASPRLTAATCTLDVRYPMTVGSAYVVVLTSLLLAAEPRLYVRCLDVGCAGHIWLPDFWKAAHEPAYYGEAAPGQEGEGATPEQQKTPAAARSEARGVSHLAAAVALRRPEELVVRWCPELGRSEASLTRLAGAAVTGGLVRLSLLGCGLTAASLGPLGRLLAASEALESFELAPWDCAWGQPTAQPLLTEAQHAEGGDGGFAAGVRAAPRLACLLFRGYRVRAAAPSFARALEDAAAGKPLLRKLLLD